MRVPGPPSDSSKTVSINLTPMIDMVFLLIIFFMTASHLSSQKNMDLDIPDARSGTVPKERPDRWTVNIRRDGSVFSGQQPVSLDELRARVAARVQAEPGVKVYLRADKLTPHRQVRLVMNAMAEAGVGDFIFGVFSPAETRGGEP